MPQPSERGGREHQVGGFRQGRQVNASAHPQRIAAPEEHEDDHDGGDVHDPQRLTTRFMNAFGVFPPEIESDGDGK